MLSGDRCSEGNREGKWMRKKKYVHGQRNYVKLVSGLHRYWSKHVCACARMPLPKDSKIRCLLAKGRQAHFWVIA